MQVKTIAIHAFCQTYAPERLGPPVSSACFAHLLAIGKLLSHVMQQKIGIGPDKLKRMHRIGGIASGDEFGGVAGRAARCVKELLAPQHHRLTDITPLRHGEVFSVEGHEIENLIRRLHRPEPRLHARWHGETFFLPVGTVAIGIRRIRCGDADIVGESACALVAYARVLSFPTKPPDFRFAGAMILDPSGTPLNAVPILVVRIGVGQNIGVADSFYQAKPKGRHGNAC